MSLRGRPWLKHVLFSSLLVGISLILFRGALRQGMEMDEISRVINVIPLLNGKAEPLPPAMFHIDLFGHQVPVMFKQYISSAYLLRFLPLAFFNDYLFGIRFLHWFYFVLSLGVFYLVVTRFDAYVAVFGTLLVAVSPLFYPEVRISFADSLQIFYLSLAGLFFERFFRHGEKRLDLFLGFLLLFLCANQMFYFSWVIAGLLTAGIILYPKEILRCFYPVSRSLVVAGALMLGMVNFVAYNAVRGFPTLMVLVNRLFRPNVYNAAPIDYRPAKPFADELMRKLQQLPGYFDAPRLYVGLYAAVATVTILFLLYLWRRGRFSENRLYFLPGLVALSVFSFILITPNTFRVGHYIYLVPFLQLSTLAAVMALGRMLGERRRLRKTVVIGLPVLLTALSFTVSYGVVTATNRTGGRIRFSPAIFDFVNYLNAHAIDSGDVLFTVWGLHLQPYFLNHGQFRMRRVVYELITRPTEAEKESYFEFLFSSYQALPMKGDALYFPVYARIDADVRKALLGFLERHNGQVVLEKVFPERDGQPAILLYRLDSAREFLFERCAPVRRARTLPSLRIERFGPTRAEAGRDTDLPMWFIASDLTPSTKVVLDGALLNTVFGGNSVTALVPRQAFTEPRTLNLFLFDPSRSGRSPAVELQVE